MNITKQQWEKIKEKFNKECAYIFNYFDDQESAFNWFKSEIEKLPSAENPAPTKQEREPDGWFIDGTFYKYLKDNMGRERYSNTPPIPIYWHSKIPAYYAYPPPSPSQADNEAIENAFKTAYCLDPSEKIGLEESWELFRNQAKK